MPCYKFLRRRTPPGDPTRAKRFHFLVRPAMTASWMSFSAMSSRSETCA